MQQPERVIWNMNGWASGDWTPTSKLEPKAHTAISYGIIIHETENEVILAPHVAEGTLQRIEQHVAGDITIPKSAIVSRSKLYADG
jgi:hypothetical protein